MGKGSLAALAALLIGGFMAVHAAGVRAASTQKASTQKAGVQEAGDLSRTAREAAALIDAGVRNRHMVMLGEIHGTAEIPAVAGELAARWTQGAGKQPVLLGLEAASTDQARVDRYLASKGAAADRTDLIAGTHWTEPKHDGRDSRAMAALIERMRALRAAGADISIAMFDAPGAGERDARMAASLRRAIAAHPKSRVLVLTGNVHAMTGKPPEMYNDGKRFVPPTTMARHLADLHPVSIEFRAMQGDAWVCQDTCGRHAFPTSGRSIAGPTLEPHDPGASWDYLAVLPRFTASPPAVPAGS
jgi:hypothetical protein